MRRIRGVLGGLVVFVAAVGWFAVLPAQAVWPEDIVILSSGTAGVQDADAAVDSLGRVHAVWSAEGELYHCWNAGAGWSSVQAIGAGRQPALASDGAGKVYLAFTRDVGATSDVYLAVWQNGIWESALNLSESDNPSLTPTVAVASSGAIVVAWSEQITDDTAWIFTAMSVDGSYWSVGPLGFAEGRNPTAAFDAGGRPAVAWQSGLGDDQPEEIFFSRWNGIGWGNAEDVSVTLDAPSRRPALAWQGDAWVLAWVEEEGSTARVVASVLDAGSEIWSEPVVLSEEAPLGRPAVTYRPDGAGLAVWGAGERVRGRRWSPASGWGAVEDIAVGMSLAREARGTAGAMWGAIWLAGTAPERSDVYYVGESASSPTPTASPTATSSPTPTQTFMLTATPTWTPTPTGTPAVTLFRMVWLPLVYQR